MLRTRSGLPTARRAFDYPLFLCLAGRQAASKHEEKLPMHRCVLLVLGWLGVRIQSGGLELGRARAGRIPGEYSKPDRAPAS